MSEGLEALQQLKEINEGDIRSLDYLDVVEKELKRLNAIDDILSNGGDIYNVNQIRIIANKLKALEIIKPLVHLTKDANGCWLWLGLNAVQITQEQYDSLEKVLL